MIGILAYMHRNWVMKPVQACSRRFGERGVLIVLAVLIGCLAAVAACLLHELVVLFNHISDWVREGEGRFGIDHRIWLAAFFLLPLMGVSLSCLTQQLIGGARYAKSLSPLILALFRHRTSIPLRETINHVISSAFAVGFGGSAGLEAPSVLTGAAIGANTAGFAGINKSRRNLLIGCGAAAAISAIFKSPIGGVLFVAEVLLPEFRVGALVPILISSAVATVLSRVLPGSEHLLSLEVDSPWRTDAVPFYFLCGIFSAMVGVYIIRVAYRMGEFLRRRIPRRHQRLLAGGSALCLLLFIFPPLRGQGYRFIENIFAGDLDKLADAAPLLSHLGSPAAAVALVVIAAVLIKVVTSVLTVDSGGDGGIFAPTMFIGAFAGFAFARLINLTGIISLQEENFVIVGMCGVFTAVMRAPLTGIFLIAEVTGGYILLVPLMIVSAVSWFTSRFFEPNSIYHKALVEDRLIYSDRDKTVLLQVAVNQHLQRECFPLRADDTVQKAFKVLDSAPFRPELFPVLDERNRLIGVVRVERLMSAMLNPVPAGALLVFDLMDSPRCVLSVDDDMAWAMTNFDRCQQNILPVNAPDGSFAGFISQAACFNKFRSLVRESDNF